MAGPSKSLNFQNSEEDDDGRFGNLEYHEDEYGYVQPYGAKASQALISQLPSRHLDVLLDEEEVEKEDKTKSSLRRKDSHYRTLQLKNATLNSRHKGISANKIYEILNSNPDSNEEEKMKTLREMHQSLTIKRQVKEKFDADRERKIASHSLGSCLRCKLSVGMTLHKVWFELKNLFYLLEPWHSSIKAIQGQFGSCVTSYFIFLRWLLYLNLCNFFITFCFVIVPEIIHKNFKNSTSSFLVKDAGSFQWHDLLTGTGWLMNSLLYFGSYSSDVIQPIEGFPYNMPLAYLCAVGSNMLIILIVVSVSITASYQKNYVDTAGEIKNVFCNKIFSAWDYAIETENAAILQKRTFCNDLRELLYMKRLSEKTITLSQNVLQKVSFVCVSLFSLAVIGGVGYLTYFLLERKALKVDIPILQHMTFAITVILISSIFYYLLKFATTFEAYVSNKTRLYFTMIRVVMLRAVVLGIVTYFWMIVYKPPRHQEVCYETELGSELYRLILVNFVIAILIFTFMGEFVRKLVHSHITQRIALKEFDVAYNTLDLIYFQTLAWLAMFYVPFISLVIVIVLVLMFYIKMVSMSSNCHPPKRSWSINEMQTFYLVLTFVMFLFTVVTVGYTIFGLETSDCGPFKNFDTVGEALRSTILGGKVGNVVADIVKYITAPSVLVAVFCALCLAVHYMRAQANAHISVIKKIRETLILASKDKVFLLKLFDEAFNAHYQNRTKNAHKVVKTHNESNGSARGMPTDNNIVVNEAYSDYSDQSLESPIHRKYHPNYIPADVPINRLPHSSPLQNSPNEAHRGSPFPPHQPGFRHVLQGQNHM
ncbi:transmembrane channel-like protein 5 isoform X2 [Parasteatoda tepidariorum]|nr:transmembrane channel-like protein 5 isoform X2 [Parasteatoda tepidariorum]XP_042909532.1 transmembrane channel-like protein 5 isoform X2 [Parasteatoda tepidariorum]XP_042909533.1 transmembrane channel-like protein 5 isoform X2 [Parasteatoda tepidariorum]